MLQEPGRSQPQFLQPTVPRSTGEVRLPSPTMHTMTRSAARPARALAAALLALTLLLLGTGAPAALAAPEDAVVLAAEERERRPIAPTQRDQLGLLLYGVMAVVALAGVATLRRQLRGDREQTDGEFRWR